MSTSSMMGSAQPQEPPSPFSFIIGQDRAGHWIALETHGKGGGIFRSRHAALDYAAFETDRRPGAVRLTTQPLELKI